MILDIGVRPPEEQATSLKQKQQTIPKIITCRAVPANSPFAWPVSRAPRKQYPKAATPISSCTCSARDDEEDGVINWKIQTDDYRIVTGGREGADIGDKQVLTTNTEISFDWKVEWLLFIISVTLFIGAGEMAFPIRKIFQKITDRPVPQFRGPKMGRSRRGTNPSVP